ncbi:MAG: pimeloyl-ACP methyl ester carboxylesterase [Paraglaciecola sp.]|jgi:pimeloyl-ACP methyl ester carboxylesterase
MSLKSILKYSLFLLSVIFAGVLAFNYAPDRSVEDLKKRWAYSNSQFIEVNGMEVHYRINGTGQPLVLIHGTGASLHTWERWTDILEKDFQVISLDMPAFGLTGPSPERDYSLDNYAQFLDAFLIKIGLDTFHLAGNSLGGAIAWKYASLFPKKIKKMVLIDASGYPFDKTLPLAFRMAKNPIMGKFLLKITPKALFWKSIREVYFNDDLVTEELIDRYYELYLRAGNRQAFVDRVRNIEYNDASPIKTIETPTLIMWGADDKWIPVRLAGNFKRDLINSESIIYKESGHVPMEEIPQVTAEDARIFLLR